MKKYLLFVVFFMLLFVNVKIVKADNYFEWVRTKIDVPIGSNLGDYEDLYVVKFHLNGSLSNDYYIAKEQNGTTFSTVLTNKIGQYKVMYTAYNEDYNVYSDQYITFNVYDNEKPVITGPSSIRVLYGSEIDYSQFYTFSDNETEREELKIIINDENVSYDFIGEYMVRLNVMDRSGNTATKDIILEIYDNIRPVIKLKKELFFSYGKDIVIDDYFSVTDNYDLLPDVVINDFDYEKLGKSTIKIMATDSSLNSIEQSFICYLIDDTPPVIKLKSNSDSIDIKSVDNIERLLNDYIIEISDNYSEREMIDLEIETDLKEIKIGTYTVKYIAEDENGNVKEEVLILQLAEEDGPEFISELEYSFNVGDNVDLNSLALVYDKYDEEAKDKVELINTNVDFTKAGTYRAVYRAYNSSGKYTIQEVTIKILANEVVEYSKININPNDLIIYGVILIEVIGLLVFLLIKLIRRKKVND